MRGHRSSAAADAAGFVALAVSPHFEHTLALDPSRKMVDVGMQPEHGAKITYAVGTAEDADAAGVGRGEEGADLVVAGEHRPASISRSRRSADGIGQAAHWFDHAKTWAQLATHVRPGGTVAYLVSSTASPSRRTS